MSVIEVWTAADLDNVRNNLSGNYVQMADIDMSSYVNWIPIGIYSSIFTGLYDGQDYTITNLNISGSGKAIISNIELSNEYSQEEEGKVLLLNYGDSLSIEMDLTLDCSVVKPAIKIIFLDQELRSIADCFSQFCGFDLQAIKSSRINVQCRNIPFNAGIYSITICVLDLLSNDEVLSRYDNAAYFQIAHSCRSWSSFLLKGDWEQYER